MINKNKFSIKDTKKVLRKVGKRWLVASTIILGLGASGVAVNTGITLADSANHVAEARQIRPRRKGNHGQIQRRHLSYDVVKKMIARNHRHIKRLQHTLKLAKPKGAKRRIARKLRRAIAKYHRNTKAVSVAMSPRNRKIIMNTARRRFKANRNYLHRAQLAFKRAHGRKAKQASRRTLLRAEKRYSKSMTRFKAINRIFVRRNRKNGSRSSKAKQPVTHQNTQTQPAQQTNRSTLPVNATPNNVVPASMSQSIVVPNDAPASSTSVTPASSVSSTSALNFQPSSSIDNAQHASEITSHNSMVQRKAQNALIRADHQAVRRSTEAQHQTNVARQSEVARKSSSDQQHHDDMQSLRSGSNDPAKVRQAQRSVANSVHSQHQAKRSSMNALRNSDRDPAKIAHASHAKSVFTSQALVNQRAAASADQSIADDYQSYEGSRNASVASSAAESADKSIANSYRASVAVEVSAKDHNAKSNAISASDQKIQNYYVNSVNASVSGANRKQASLTASIANSNIERSIADSYANQSNRKIVASLKTSVANSVARTDSAIASADQSIADSYIQSVNTSVANANHSKAASAATSADASIANSYRTSVTADVQAKDSAARSKAITSSDQKIQNYYVNSVSASVSGANHNKANAAASTADSNIESSIATSYAQSADRSLDDSIATSYANSADHSIASVSASSAKIASSVAKAKRKASYAAKSARADEKSRSERVRNYQVDQLAFDTRDPYWLSRRALKRIKKGKRYYDLYGDYFYLDYYNFSNYDLDLVVPVINYHNARGFNDY